MELNQIKHNLKFSLIIEKVIGRKRRKRSHDSLKIYPLSSKSFDDGEDSMYFKLILNMTKEQIKYSYLSIEYIGKRGQKGDGVQLKLYVKEKLKKVSLQNKRFFYTFETHVLEIEEKDNLIQSLYICLENNQLFSKDQSIQLEPNIDYGHTFFKTHFKKRYNGLDYVPPDPDLLDTITIKTSIIPQRSPVWFKIRAEVSGSKLNTLLGWFIPTVEKEPNWSYFNKRPISDWVKSIMTMGRLREIYIVIAYLMYYKKRTFYEVGSLPHPKNPQRWSASPDGYAIDKELGKIALEFKASRQDCKMKGYYYPQVYFEMGALETNLANLVRYHEFSETDSEGRWSKKIIIKCFEEERNQYIERSMLSCITRSLQNLDNLRNIVQEEEYVDLREMLEKKADNVAGVNLSNSKDTLQMIKDIEKYKRELLGSIEIPEVDKNDFISRHYDIMEMIDKNDVDSAKSLILDQISGYSGLI